VALFVGIQSISPFQIEADNLERHPHPFSERSSFAQSAEEESEVERIKRKYAALRDERLKEQQAKGEGPSISFFGAISSVFEPHMALYVNDEAKKLLDEVSRHLKAEKWGALLARLLTREMHPLAPTAKSSRAASS
jgi:hypothetical protein